ncbi:MAG TPA: replication factor C small subunit [Nitrososphaerales archaeon]|nr:replication factor C small subunit [Nitrososphaerales archaeon]
MSIESLMWVEKYRPHKIDELVNQEEVKERLKPLLDKKDELPHLLFAGPPGSGKTTTALVVAKELLGELASDYVLSLNASDERGIDAVRERVKTFASYSDRREGVPFRLVVLDEADEMTHDAQTALRRIMEETSRYTRFVLICNYSSNLIEPIQSRCAIFRFKRIGEEDVTARLKKIAKAEDVKVTEKVLQAISAAVDGDLRQGINLLQAASAGGSEVTLERVNAATGTSVKERAAEIVRLALGGDFPAARLKLVELTRVYGIPESDFLRFANEEIAKGSGEKTADAIKILAEYDYRLAMGANPEVQLTALLAELAALRSGAGGRRQ